MLLCRALLAGMILAATFCTGSLLAGDWPQILGPQRDGVAQGETLLSTWPDKGPAVAWRAEVGAGYAGPAIADGQVLVFERVGDKEQLRSLDLATGKERWKTEFAATYRGGIDADIGPRCVPVIHAGRVYAFGAGGDLHCVEFATGKLVWSRALAADYQAPDGYFGAGSSPIVAGDRLWLNLGGKGAGLVALSLDTGKTLYKGTAEQASYSSPTLSKIANKECVVFVTRYNALGIASDSGETLFSFPFGARGPTVNAATPLVFDNQLFVSASYGIGAKLADISGAKPKILWENDSSMSSQYTTCVYRAGYLYGVDGREDQGGASLRCIDAVTGKVQWSEDYGIAHMILAGEKLLIVRNDGEIQLALATPKAFTPLAEAQLTRGTIRALPALSQGKLVVRTVASGGRGELLCVEVGKTP